MAEALRLAAATWQPTRDGIMMMDYSSQSRGERKGKHVSAIEEDLFQEFVQQLQGLDVDIMLEIKDKEASAHRACGILRDLSMVPAAPAGYVTPVFPDASQPAAAKSRKPRKSAA
jgi:UV DNA damage endonuclease